VKGNASVSGSVAGDGFSSAATKAAVESEMGGSSSVVGREDDTGEMKVAAVPDDDADPVDERRASPSLGVATVVGVVLDLRLCLCHEIGVHQSRVTVP
jgi:hypothetical protein